MYDFNLMKLFHVISKIFFLKKVILNKDRLKQSLYFVCSFLNINC